jgi:anti-anti-sigma factor
MENSFDHVAAEQIGDVLVLEVNATALNDFDLAHATSDEIEKASANWPNKKIILSLKNVEFVTSVGLILFARLITHVKQTGTRLVLCEAADPIAKVLSVSRMIKSESGLDGQRLLLKADRTSALSALN